MCEPGPLSSGQCFPEAITIRGDPGPSTRQRELFEDAQAKVADEEWAPSQKQEWREWHVSSARHGPERTTRMPTFVKSTTNYDELGRSAIEGVGVEVDQGRRNRGKERATGEAGEDVGEWYKSLSKRSTPTPTPTTSGMAVSEVGQSTVVDLTGEDDEADTPVTTIDKHIDTVADSSRKRPVLRVNRSEWFIRRALLSRSHAEPSSTVSSPGPSSISGMLNIEDRQPRVAPAQYVLGPDNKGYELLKSRHGWEGGGLGRPPDWEERARAIGAETGTPTSTTTSMVISPPVELESDVHGEPVVDLTVESEPEPEDDIAVDPVVRQGGPGRTAPIATSLKLDRVGLGYQRNKRAERDAEKKVTHTIEEIRRVQQRSRHPPPKHGVELGKKGKIKWKERDKREREDRKRLQAMLNA